MKNPWLMAGAAGSGIAAILHLGCIIFGGDWYRFLGAGERMAQMAEAGHGYPTVITLIIVGALSVWTLYALSGAGAIRRLPLLPVALCVVSFIYLARGVAFIFIMPLFPENSTTFWLVSSGICFGLGLCFAIGTAQQWPLLKTPSV